MRIVVLAIGIAVASAGCTPEVKLKLDTPEATVATLIKLYAASDKNGGAAHLFDGEFTKMNARKQACVTEELRSLQCEREVMRALDRGPLGSLSVSKECMGPSIYTACTCGAKGSEAAKRAPNFSGSDLDKELALAHLSPDTCKITESRQLDDRNIFSLVQEFSSLTCAAAATTETSTINEAPEAGMKRQGVAPSQSVATPPAAAGVKMTAVTFTCGVSSMTAILRNSSGTGWQILSFDDDTMQALALSALGNSIEQGRKQKEAEQNKREAELNRDLK